MDLNKKLNQNSSRERGIAQGDIFSLGGKNGSQELSEPSFDIAGSGNELLDRHAAESIAISHLFERSSVARELHAAAVLLRREMRQLVSFAAGNDCRVILSGDSRQHHSVERGDALRILEKSAVVASAALTRIFRQQAPALRAAIEDLSQGKTEEGLDKLDKFGVIREIEKADERISLPSRVDCAVGR